MRIPLFWRVLPVHCLIAALFILPIWQRHAAAEEALRAGRAAQADLLLQNGSHKVGGEPVIIVLPHLGIDLKVDNGQYDFRSSHWSVTGTTANYAQNTAEPNNMQGKTLIYGHWTPKVFGPTKALKKGDMAYVYTSSGHILAYRYEYKTVVDPTDTGIFKTFKGKPGLVLMTCEGAWAQHRRLMYFDLKGAK